MILTGIAGIIIVLVLFIYMRRIKMQRTGQNDSLPIPFVRKQYMPIFGHLMPFLRHKSKFIADCQLTYGSSFWIKILSQRIIFLLDPHDWQLVNRNSNLSSSTEDLAVTIFGVRREFAEKGDSPEERARFFKQHLQNAESLNPLISRFVECVQEAMIKDRKRIGVSKWQHCGLLELSHRMIFEASGRALFGEINPLQIEQSFLTFDRHFHYFVLNLPNWLQSLFLRKGIQARTDMNAYFDSRPHAIHESDFMRERSDRFLQIEDRKPNDFGAFQTAMFWASVGNTIPCTFWCLYYILQDLKTIERINEEIHMHLPQRSLSNTNDSNIETWTSEALAKCEYLESAINETLRLTSKSIFRRVCIENTEIQLNNGTSLPLKRGDSVFIYSEATHLNEHFFPEPEKYKYDRFVGKNTETIKGLLPFGIGKSICPGRYFARAEIKICLALILHFINLEFMDSTVSPHSQRGRTGFGIASPDRDIPIRYRYKE